MLKKLIFIIAMLFYFSCVTAQDEIILEKFTEQEMNSIDNPELGLMLYCTNCEPEGIYYFNSIYFVNVTTGFISNFNPQEHVVSTTGKVWLNKNLGALRVANSLDDEDSLGYLYQWGRRSDGHQLRDSDTTNILACCSEAGHDKFIISENSPYQWSSVQNNDLWQGDGSINDPCPNGFRLPTLEEWFEESSTWETQDRQGAFNSKLKIPSPGWRKHLTGEIINSGGSGHYWSSTISGTKIRIINFRVNSLYPSSHFRADGFPVRCIKN